MFVLGASGGVAVFARWSLLLAWVAPRQVSDGGGKTQILLNHPINWRVNMQKLTKLLQWVSTFCHAHTS